MSSSTATHVDGAFAADIPEGLPRPGELVAGKLLVERVIGRGGMGLVYAAHHQSLDERVALKFVLPEVARRSDAVKRFLKEARAAAKVRGEHVGSVLDVAELPDGTPYMVMEYLEGQDLGTLLEKRGPFPIEQAIDFILQACEALAQAHAANIVHRDLKPSNLFLCRRANGGPLIKVLDFGISKLDEKAGDGRLTGSTSIMGSPSYMSPEQLRSSREVDARADIWSLGVVLYELLTGTLPFDGSSLVDLGVVVMTSATPSVRAKRPDVPEGLDAAITRCLAKDPRERFQDVSELATAIASFGSREAPISARSIALTLGKAPPSARPHPVGDPQRTAPVVAYPSFSNPLVAHPAFPQSDAAFPSTATINDDRPRARVPLIAALSGFGLFAIVGIGLIVATRSAPRPTSLVAPPSTANVVASASTSTAPARTTEPVTTATVATPASASAAASASAPHARPTTPVSKTPHVSAPSAASSTPPPPPPPPPPGPSGITLDRHG